MQNQAIPANTPCPVTADVVNAAVVLLRSAVFPSAPFGHVEQVVNALQQALSISATLAQQTSEETPA